MKILIVSATKNNNYKLANNLNEILLKLNLNSKVISLENYPLPLYTDDIYDKNKDKYLSIVTSIIDEFLSVDKIIFCGPEYNGSIPPIMSNTIAWMSVSTNNWRDSFNDKFALLATSSGGPGGKFITSFKIQLEHLGMIVLPRFISVNKNNPLDAGQCEKILKQFASV